MRSDIRQPKWKMSKGYTLNLENGAVEKEPDGICTLHFYLAAPGDTLHLLDKKYKYTVAIYVPQVEDKYIYTYVYQPEESWTIYRKDLSMVDFIQNDYIFTEKVYFRVGLKRELREAESLSEHYVMEMAEILQWRKKSTKNINSPKYKQMRQEECKGQYGLQRWMLFEKEKEKTVSSVCRKQAQDSQNFLLLTDSHYTVNGTWEDTMNNLRRVTDGLKAEGVQIDGLIHLGDLTDGLLPREVTGDYVKSMQADMAGLEVPFYFVPGNHDYNYFRGNPEPFSEEEMRRLYLPGREHLYYHAALPGHLHLVFLDSFDPGEEVRYGFHEEELDWLEKLLEAATADWRVLVFSHVPPVARLHYWSDVIRGSRRLIRILLRYQARTGGLLGYVHGHNHADQVDVREGFPIISIGCNKCEYFADKKPEGAIAWERTLHTVSQDLWDICIVSPGSGTMDLIRFGAGEDRQITKISEKFRRMDVPMKKVITYGTYDLFHEGHYNLLKRAKELGDYLIVGVTTAHYDEQRGKLNIVDPLLERIENVRKTGFVDEIIIEDHEGQKIEDIQKYDVDIFTLGSDWKGMFDYLKNYCQVVYLERTPGISSTMLRKGKFPIIRMGVVGSGRIAPRFLSEAKYVSGLNVQCVYNPHRESAEQFAAEYALESYSASYEEFLEAVDGVYIATPHETHYDYVRRALLAGKHVMCEKPLALTRRQAVELFALAKEKASVLMEGIKTAYCPGFSQIVNIAKSGRIGEIRDVEACFSRLTDPRLREMVDIRYGGAFLEFGSYTLLPILKLLGTGYESVEINSIPAENGIDLYTKIQFRYPGGFAMSKTGVGVKSEGQLLISGTKGYILAESPWWLTRKFQVRYEDPGQIETYTPKFVGDGLRYEIADFVSHIHGYGGHAFKLTEEESIAMADVVERFLEKRRAERKLAYEKNRAAGVKIWAHRGCSYRYPENTLPAFRAACELPGIAGIELDIQLSKDGTIVVFHDETLDRLMDTAGCVRDYTLAELQQMRFRDWEYENGGSRSGFGGERKAEAAGKTDLSGDAKKPEQAGRPRSAMAAVKEEMPGKTEAPGQEEMPGKTEASVQEEMPGKTEASVQEEMPGKTEASGQVEMPGKTEASVQAEMPRIPAMGEVLELIKPYALERGIFINIELKNSRIPYEGMEEKILQLVKEYGMEEFVVYSTFNEESLKKLKRLDSKVRTGILQTDIRDCLRLMKESMESGRADGGSGGRNGGWIDALHPNVDSVDEGSVDEDSVDVDSVDVDSVDVSVDVDSMDEDSVDVDSMDTGNQDAVGMDRFCKDTGDEGSGYNRQVIVRAWNGREPFYRQVRQYVVFDLCDMKRKGITDFITNVPEEYLQAPGE